MRQEVSATSGYAKPGFEAVREAFTENFERRSELGAACSIYYRGEKVVDLWGGIRDKSTREPWEENTMVIVASATKGLAGLAMALAHSRRLYDYIGFMRLCDETKAFCSAANVTGQPAMTLSLGQSKSGLPIGAQFTSRFGDESTLIRIASWLEEEMPWRDRVPAVHVSR